MIPSSEQRELSQIADGLRADDPRFARQMAVREGMLRWAAVGWQNPLLLLVLILTGTLAVALLGRAQAFARWITATAGAAITPSVDDLMIGAKARPGWSSEQHHRGQGPR